MLNSSKNDWNSTCDSTEYVIITAFVESIKLVKNIFHKTMKIKMNFNGCDYFCSCISKRC